MPCVIHVEDAAPETGALRRPPPKPRLASARVLRKVGMKREGLLREFARKENGFEDAVIRAILRREWGKETSGPGTTDHRIHAFRI